MKSKTKLSIKLLTLLFLLVATFLPQNLFSHNDLETVKAAPENNIINIKIKLNMKNLTLLEGDLAQIEATVTPKGKVRWKTSNSKIVSVFSDGSIKAKKAGVATITAIANDGSTAKCKVVVKLRAKLKVKLTTDTKTKKHYVTIKNIGKKSISLTSGPSLYNVKIKGKLYFTTNKGKVKIPTTIKSNQTVKYGVNDSKNQTFKINKKTERLTIFFKYDGIDYICYTDLDGKDMILEPTERFHVDPHDL